MNTALKTFVALLSLSTLYFGFMYSGASEAPESDVAEYSMPELKSDGVPAQTVPVASLRDFNNAIVDIAERTNPTVVTVTTTQTVRQQQMDPFSQFFGFPNKSQGQGQEYTRQGLGSGVIASEDGYILTNNHVIEEADEITIEFMNGEQMKATVVGTDPQSDIAVLKVDGENLPAISFGDSDALRVGEMVLAIGSPLDTDLAHTVSMGIVSAKSRNIGILDGDNGYESFIQTDAAINPGNSGGALINMDGNLIGINSAIASQSGGNQGIGFAIPINMVRNVMESLIEHGRVIRGYLGVRIGSAGEELWHSYNMDARPGLAVGEITEGSPADEAGLQEGDIIVAKDGQPIRTLEEFRFDLAGTAPGTDVQLDVFRDGDFETVTVTLGDMGESMAAAVGQSSDSDLSNRIGFSVEDLTDAARRQLGVGNNINGVVVSSISQTSEAFERGLREGDVIFQVQNRSISNTDEFLSAVNSAIDQQYRAIRVRVNRDGLIGTIAFSIE